MLTLRYTEPCIAHFISHARARHAIPQPILRYESSQGCEDVDEIAFLCSEYEGLDY